MPRRNSFVIVLALLAAAAGVWSLRHEIAIIAAPSKEAAISRSDAAFKADELFWKTFHGGEYDKIQSTLAVLTAAYLKDPNDAKTAAHIAWLHNWRVAERARIASPAATITDNTFVARRYFEEAVKLDPSDARYLGFLAGHTMAEGSLHKDERLTRKGYFMMLDAINAWPEFNLFTGGYVMSRLPADSPQFREGLEWQWEVLDKCIGEKLDRANPDFAQYLSLETTRGPKRACWNSWIAPHNLEGFFLNMGDMLVKAGDWQTGRKIYANARLLKTYPTWRYHGVVEDRIARAQANVALLNAKEGTTAVRIMIDSEFACMACHQQ